MKPIHKNLDYVDTLRALAILAVVMVHVNQYGEIQAPHIFSKIFNEGARGVQLFFMASAFTLFLSYQNRLNSENNPTRNFFIRRFFRIAPMYYLGILFYLWQNDESQKIWLGNQTSITPLNIVSNFSFTHGFNPYYITSLVPGGWTIGVEMCFYAILPFLFSKIKNLNQAFLFFISCCILQFILHLFLINNPLISDSWLWQAYLKLYFPSQLPIFALGIILFFLVK